MSIITAGTSVTNGLILESNQDGNLLVKTGPSATTAATFDSGGSVVISTLLGTSVNFTNATFTTLSATNFSVTSITITNVLQTVQGGTGRTSATAYAVICGGTTSTGAQQSVVSVGNAGQVLTSNGAGALPTFQAAASGAQDYIVKSYGVT